MQPTVTRVTHNGFDFDFEYDVLGRNSKIKASNSELVNLSYDIGEVSTVTSAYANGFTTVVTTDSRGNPLTKTINGKEISSAVYDEMGNFKTA